MTLFDTIVLVTVIMQGVSFWFIGRGRMIHSLMISVYVGYAIIETWLAIRDSAQWSVGLFVLLDFWCIAMAFKGWRATKEKMAVR